MDLAIELQRIYDSEINVEIGWFWDCGVEVRLGETVGTRPASLKNILVKLDAG